MTFAFQPSDRNTLALPEVRLSEQKDGSLTLLSHLEFLPELHVAFLVAFGDRHVVVLTLLLVQQLVPSETRGRGG